MKHHQRRLPHWDTVDATLFVTFRLHGSLPRGRVFPTENLCSGEAFVAVDRLLDGAATGPRYLAMPEVADIVSAALEEGQHRSRYSLHSYVVMPNHVHVLVTPHVPSTRWLGPLKGFTAHEANGFLGLRGRSFWQDESYDLVRSPEEFRRIQRYIENNPVKAGLTVEPAQFRWSSAYRAA